MVASAALSHSLSGELLGIQLPFESRKVMHDTVNGLVRFPERAEVYSLTLNK